MPFGDGTGPLGLGPGYWRGNGRGRGFYNRYPYYGRCWRYPWFYRGQQSTPDYPDYPPVPSAKEEVEILKEEANMLKEELTTIESRLQELEGSKKKK